MSSAPWNGIWPAAWDDAQEVQAWEHWLVSGRLAIARAQLELGVGRLDEAVTWSRRALEMAQSGGRPKYEAIALQTLGQALTQQGLAEDAVGRALEGRRDRRRARVAARAVGDPRRAGVGRASSRYGPGAAAGRGCDHHPRRRVVPLTRAGETYLAAPQVRAVLE